MSQQIGTRVNPALGVTPAVIAASANGAGVDCSGYDEVVYAMLVGAVVSLTSWDVKIQESATSGGTYTDISGAAFATITTATHQLALTVPVNYAKPFQRVVQTLVGTSVACGVVMLRCKPPLLPAAAGS